VADAPAPALRLARVALRASVVISRRREEIPVDVLNQISAEPDEGAPGPAIRQIAVRGHITELG
jgi:hypothetical protein